MLFSLESFFSIFAFNVFMLRTMSVCDFIRSLTLVAVFI
nr:MAG TPA: hypothetical protein [Caudoviricetes sp.]